MSTLRGRISENNLSLAGRGAAALAIGLGLGVCSAQPANAVIIHSSDFGFTPVTLVHDVYVLDVDNDSLGDFYLAHYSLLYGNIGLLAPYEGRAVVGIPKADGMYGVYHNVSRLNKGDAVTYDPSGIFTSPEIGLLFFNYNYPGYSYSGGEFFQDGYAGFLLAEDSDILYDWMKLLVEDDLSAITIVEWAYDDSGKPLAAGQVPITGSLLLLASGAAGVLALRRKTAEKQV